MSLPAAKGFEVGSGFEGTLLSGIEHNDEFYIDANGRTRTRTNRSGGIQARRPLVIMVDWVRGGDEGQASSSGGYWLPPLRLKQDESLESLSHGRLHIHIQGGISNGETIVVRVAFKPTSTIGQLQARPLRCCACFFSFVLFVCSVRSSSPLCSVSKSWSSVSESHRGRRAGVSISLVHRTNDRAAVAAVSPARPPPPRTR
jgi:hypothetical protein